MNSISSLDSLPTTWAWTWRLAWKDARRYRTRLLLFLAAIALGVSALVSIQSLSESFRQAVEAESKSLLGADLVLSGTQTLPDSILQVADSLGGISLRGTAFASMAQFVKSGDARLAEVRGIEQGYPYYGAFDTAPPGVAHKLWEGPYALVEESLMAQFDAQVGDSVRIGEQSFRIAGSLLSVPGGGSVGFGSPRIYIDYGYLPSTRLIRFGSRVSYFKYYKLPEGQDPDAWERANKPLLETNRIIATTVNDRKEGMERIFGNLFRFFKLIAFIALLLGGVGVASSVQVYLLERRGTIALLRCLGAPSSATTKLYVLQLLQAAFVGTVVGVGVGVALQQAWPYLLRDFLPVPVSFVIAWESVALGAGIGLGLSLLFALLPLLRIRHISPLVVLRSETSEGQGRDIWQWLLLGAIVLVVVVFASLQLQGILTGLLYTLAVAVAGGMLAAVAYSLMWAVRRLVPMAPTFALRQGLSGLYRPRNQTLTLLVTLGLSTFLLGSIFFVQENLQQQFSDFTTGTSRPNLILFDIQTDQRTGVDSLLEVSRVRRQELTPVVTLRMERVRGKTFEELRADSTLDIPWWAGEYRVSYRDSLMPSEALVEGTWQSKAEGSVIPLSVGIQLRDIFKFALGDTVLFNVQGVRMTTVVTSVRRIDFLSGSSSFQLLFPEGVLEEAPQFWVATARAPGPLEAASLQRSLVRRYPNVSVVDLAATLDNAQRLIGQISLIVQFLGAFSLATGLIVLIGTLLNSSAQRVRENALLRTLGAQTNQLFAILSVEYFFLGALAALAGLLLAVVAAWALTVWVFQAPYAPSWLTVLVGTGIVALTTLGIGLLGSLRVVRQSPLAVLRAALDA